MPASIELSNYYFHQISRFCCINVRLLQLTADDWWPACPRSPINVIKSELEHWLHTEFNNRLRHGGSLPLHRHKLVWHITTHTYKPCPFEIGQFIHSLQTFI